MSVVLLAYSLGPVAELTSGCEASYWNIVWIGLGTQLLALLPYAAIHGKNYEDIHKFRIEDYLIIGILPSVASAVIFNLFLESPPSPDTDYLLPETGPGYFGLRYMLQF